MKNLAATGLILALFGIWVGIQLLIGIAMGEESKWSGIIQMNIFTGAIFLVGLLIAFAIATKTFLKDQRLKTPLRRFAFVASVPTLGIYSICLIFPLGTVGMILGLALAEFMYLAVGLVGLTIGLWFHHLSISMFTPNPHRS
jgi:hypothetical protein